MVLVKQKYIDSAILNSKALEVGDYKTANKYAKINYKIFKKVEVGRIDSIFLIELLNHTDTCVRCLAAIDLLRLKLEIEKAVETLELISELDNDNKEIREKLTISTAKLQLENWKDKGYVD